MTLQELRYLVAVADHRHFGRAAEACHVSQPTLSAQLRKLEEGLGVALFERTNKSVHVTAIGADIVARARRVLEESRAIIEAARGATAPLEGSFNLGVIPTLGPSLLPWLAPALRARHPRLRFTPHEDLTERLIERLAAHRLDAALLALPVDAVGISAIPLFDEPFWFVAPVDHPAGLGGPVPPQELLGMPMLLLTDGHCLRDQALAICGAEAGEGADFRATSLATIQAMVGAGMGCSLIPAMALEGLPTSIVTRPLLRGQGRRIGLAFRDTHARTGDILALATLIRETAPVGVTIIPEP